MNREDLTNRNILQFPDLLLEHHVLGTQERTRKYPLNVCIFGAASDRISTKKKKIAYAIGKIIGKAGHNLIFGAASTGIMGQVWRGYDSTNPPTRAFGSTTDAIEDFENPLTQTQINKIVCRTMKDRKDLYLLSDVIIVLDGGNGTGDELLEFLTYKQLNNMVQSNQYWNGTLLLFKGGMWQSWVSLWEQMHKQNLAPHWSKFLSLVTVKDIDIFLNQGTLPL